MQGRSPLNTKASNSQLQRSTVRRRSWASRPRSWSSRENIASWGVSPRDHVIDGTLELDSRSSCILMEHEKEAAFEF